MAERKRLFEISRGSLIEVDTALDSAVHMKYAPVEELQSLGEKLTKTFKLLSGLINSNTPPQN
jgi:four helix bundle protein